MEIKVAGTESSGKNEEGSKRGYQQPALVEWGSVLKLTAGVKGGTQDGFFNGTEGVFLQPPPPSEQS